MCFPLTVIISKHVLHFLGTENTINAQCIDLMQQSVIKTLYGIFFTNIGLEPDVLPKLEAKVLLPKCVGVN